jgi:formylmethanofuran dehydrogenase subunit E
MSSKAWPDSLAGMDLDEFLKRAEELHGHLSPGVVAGAFMVDKALQTYEPGEFLNAVVETVVCLPDAVQILTPCSLGNNFMQVLDWGKFAITLYDRQKLDGVRVWLDPEAIRTNKIIASWYLRSENNGKIDKEVVIRELLSCGGEMVRSAPVTLGAALKSTEKVPTVICPDCGESYPMRQGEQCYSCQGKGYYSR